MAQHMSQSEQMVEQLTTCLALDSSAISSHLRVSASLYFKVSLLFSNCSLMCAGLGNRTSLPLHQMGGGGCLHVTSSKPLIADLMVSWIQIAPSSSVSRVF